MSAYVMGLWLVIGVAGAVVVAFIAGRILGYAAKEKESQVEREKARRVTERMARREAGS